DDLGFRAQVELLQQVDHGRNLPNLLLYSVYEFGQNSINRVEVFVQTRKLVPRGGLSGGDAKIKIDVSVNAGQQLLHHDGIPVRGGAERHLPAQRRLLPSAELLERLKIASRKADVQPFHAPAVLEASFLGPR